MELTRDTCERRLTLRRRLAADWPRPFARAELLVAPDAGPPTVLTFDGDGAEIALDDPLPDEPYDLRVRYVDAEGASTTSFPVRVEPIDILTDDAIEVAQVSFEGGEWVARWRWAVAAEYTQGSWAIERGGATEVGGPLPEGSSAEPSPTLPLGIGADFDWGGAAFTLTATDLCGRTRTSPPAAPVIATAELLRAGGATVAWTAPVVGAAEVAGYQIERAVGGGDYAAIANPEEPGELVDDLAGVSEREVCYRVVAGVVLADTLSRGSELVTWGSAPVCLTRRPRVFLPTGFSPGGGVTALYRPRLGRTEGLGYRLKIYSRWGALVYEGDERVGGWDGTVLGGEAAPPGPYLALVELTDPDGGVTRYEATVALIR